MEPQLALKYTSQTLSELAGFVFKLYVGNYQSNKSLLYSITPSENKYKLHEFADSIGMSRGTAENYSERLFNLFNELNELNLHNGLQDCPKLLEGEGKKIFSTSKFHLKVLPTETSIIEDLYKRINESKKLSTEQRHQKLQNLSPIPKSINVNTRQFIRNADVIVAALERANGICERCKQLAPFIRKRDGTHYLEVHHIKPLSMGGEDTIENAQSLCPNCHRELHFGKNP